MNLLIFQSRLYFLSKYALKLRKENMPFKSQSIFLKVYAKDLKINLTNKMILEILCGTFTPSPYNQVN